MISRSVQWRITGLVSRCQSDSGCRRGVGRNRPGIGAVIGFIIDDGARPGKSGIPRVFEEYWICLQVNITDIAAGPSDGLSAPLGPEFRQLWIRIAIW